MKKMKKVMALLLSLVMVLAMSVVAFADEATTFTIKAPATTHQYEIYQIFTGDLSGTILSNVKWGINSGKSGVVLDADLKKLTDVNSKSYAEQMAVIKPFVDFTTTSTFSGYSSLTLGVFKITFVASIGTCSCPS